MPSKAIILMYHRIVRADLDPWGMCVSPENFSGHLQAIRETATPMSLRSYVRALADDTLPERAVVVTFDDGYIDNFEQALPLLREHGVPATLFVTTCNIDSDREFWWDRLETLLLPLGQLPESLALSLPSGERMWALGDAGRYTLADREADQGIAAWNAKAGTRLGFFYDVWKNLWPLPDAQREQALEQVARWSGSGPFGGQSRRTMTAAEIRAMGQEGVMEIGAHTVDHPPLPAHASELQAAQIIGSRDRLEEIIGAPVTTFAYPHGEYSDETIRLLRESGFECAVTVEQKVAGRGCDAMKLPRFGVKNIGAERFRDQLEAWFALPAVGSS